MSKKTNQIQKLTDYGHMRLRTEMYLGGRDPHTQKLFEVNQDASTSLTDVTWVPALYTGFREILDNAADEVIGRKFGNRIDVTYDPEKMIFSVKDNGRGIPIDYDEEHKTYLATMVLSEPRAGSNFGERGDVAGTNGIGASATSNTSQWFKVKINKDGKNFSQEFKEDKKDDAKKLIIGDASIKDTKQENGTFIEYTPSKEVYKHLMMPEQFLYSRIYEFAATNPSVKVYYNGKQIKVKDKIEKTLFPTKETIVIDIDNIEQKFTSKFILVPGFVEDGDFYHSIVNRIPAFNGGTHMDAFRLTFVRNLLNALTKESKKRKLSPNRSDVTEGLMVFNVTNMQAPNFDSQSKTRLTNEEAGSIVTSFLNDADFYDKIIKKNRAWIDEIYARCEARTHKKDASELAKLQKKMTRSKVASLMDATGKDRSKCILTLAEGNSAIGGLSAVRNPQIHGGMPLRGKVLNVNGVKPKEVLDNKIIQDIMNAIGLVIGQKAKISDLRYGQVWIATDEDHDGSNICALLINFFHTYWPELFNMDKPFISRLQTPFIIAEKGKQRKYWYSSNYHEFKPEEWKGWNITRAKGLGTLIKEDWDEAIKNPALIPIVEDNEMNESLDMLFNGTRADDRKTWMGV